MPEFALSILQPSSSVSGGSAGSFNENHSASMIRTLLAEMGKMNQKIATMGDMNQSLIQRIAGLERQQGERTQATGSAADDGLQHRLLLSDVSDDMVETIRRQNDALKHQIRRLRERTKRHVEQHLLPVEHFRRQDQCQSADKPVRQCKTL